MNIFANQQTNQQPNQENSNPNSLRPNQSQQPKKKKSIAIKPQHFQSEKGLKLLYQTINNIKFDANSQINIENTMKKIVVILKTWHYQMMPKYSFDYFLQRCQALGSHKQLLAYMSKVRNIYKGKDTWQVKQGQHPTGGNVNANIPQKMQDEINQQMNYLKYPTSLKKDQEQDDDDVDNLLELMDKIEQNNKKEKKRIESDDQIQPYMPQGFQHPYSQQD